MAEINVLAVKNALERLSNNLGEIEGLSYLIKILVDAPFAFIITEDNLNYNIQTNISIPKKFGSSLKDSLLTELKALEATITKKLVEKLRADKSGIVTDINAKLNLSSN